MSERALHTVPRTVLLLGLGLLAAQLSLRTLQAPPSAHAEQLAAPPPAAVLQIASLGEPAPFAGLLALRLQAFDNQPGISIPFAALDYTKVTAWLTRMLELDPQSNYPLLMASHLYAQVPDEARQRQMLEFTYRQFLTAPNTRWRYLAHAALIAKHRLHDPALALRYAQAIRDHAHGAEVPHWATQMPIFILEDMGELVAAKIELGALLATDAIRDPAERHFLTERYAELEAKLTNTRQNR